MSLPWSEMMNLINLDNELNPTPSAIATQPKKPSSHRYNPYKKPTSSSNESSGNSNLTALHQWIDNIMQSDVPEPDLFQPVACKDATGKEIKMRNAQGKNLDRLGISLILNEDSITELWSRFEGRAVPVKFDSIRRTIRTHYKRDILIPADTKSRKNRRWAFYTEPSIHVGMTREQLTYYISAYNTNSPPSSAEKTIEEVPSHPYPTPTPSTESFFNFSAHSATNSQFSHPPHRYPFNVNPPTAQAPEFSYPPPAYPSQFKSPPHTEQIQEFTFPAPNSPITSVKMPQSPEPVIDKFISTIEQSDTLPVLEINEFDLEFDASWNSPVTTDLSNVEVETGDCKPILVNTFRRKSTAMHSPDDKAKRKRREKNNESARRHRERTKQALEELRILKVKEEERKREYDTILNERNNLLHFLYTHKCVSSPEHLQQQYGAFSNATSYVPLYQSSSYRGNAQPFRSNHDYTVEQAQMLPRPIGFCMNDYKEWDRPTTTQNIEKPTSQDQSTRPKYTNFREFLDAKTGFTPASGRYTPLGKMHFWNIAISPLTSARGQPITPVFDSGVRECKKNSPLSEVGSVDENK